MKARAYGNSMEPIIKSSDEIKLARINPEDVKVGDVVSFRINGLRGLIIPQLCHRIISINKNNKTFTSKGDNRSASDPHEIDVPISHIKYIFIEVCENKSFWEKILNKINHNL